MKKAVSLVLAAILLSSSVVPTLAQKRLTTESKKQKATADSTQFESFSAHTDGTGVWLSWRMRSEVGNIGFYVVRVDKAGVEHRSADKFVGGAALHGRELPSYGDSYSYFDRDGSGDSSYYLETRALNGARSRTHQIYPEYVSNLQAVAGERSNQLTAGLESEQGNPEKSILTYTKEIANEMSENAIVPDPATHKTVISTPGAVRIGVRNEGLHRVTAAQLDAAGFDTDSDSSLWQLYVDGVEQAIIVGANAEYIEFYGKGVDTNEADVRRYYLINGTVPGKRIGTRVATRGTSTVVTPGYLQTFAYKHRWQWVDDIINQDYDNYFGRPIDTSAYTTYNFNFTGVDFASPNATVRLKFQGYSFGTHQVEVLLNDHLLGTAIGSEGEVSFDAAFFIPTSHLLEGANVFKFKATGPTGDYNFFDSVSVDFSRKYVATANKLSFYTQNYRTAKLDGFTSSDVRVFDITRESEPVLMTNLDVLPNGPTFGVDIPASRGRSFFAVEGSALQTPVSVTANNPELLGAPTNGADLIIIYYKTLDYGQASPVDFGAVAQTWADYRMAQGTSVKVVEVSDIYDEFNYGSLSSDSIRSFLSTAHSTWMNPPEYVLLIGDASWDPRNVEGVGFFSYVPAKIVSTFFTDTCSDEAMADFNGDGFAEVSIGRIPARTPEQVTVAYDKMVWWEAQAGNPMDRGALFAHDLDSTGYPFSIMSQTLRNKIPGVNATTVQRGGTVGRDTLIAGINTGNFIVNYSGHGSAGSWNGDFFSTPMFWNLQAGVPPVTSHDPSIYTMLTCLNGFYHWLYNPSLAEALVTTPGKGAVASWASSGKTTPDMQAAMAIRFYEQLNAGNMTKMGDLIKDAKATLVDWGADVRLSWALIGDPMLKVRPPAAPTPIGHLDGPIKK